MVTGKLHQREADLPVQNQGVGDTKGAHPGSPKLTEHSQQGHGEGQQGSALSAEGRAHVKDFPALESPRVLALLKGSLADCLAGLLSEATPHWVGS